MTAASTGLLEARAEPDPTTPTACAIPSTAGYTSLENQLYRVEIHDGGDISKDKVTFKWSRDNGSVVTGWTGENGNNLTVTSVGPDSVLGFAAGQWVELTDDTHELSFQPGTMVPLTNVEGLTLTMNPPASGPPTAFASFPLNPKVRRWDSAGLVTATAGTWFTLENGVQVQFAKGTYTTGDYWLIPARTLTGNVNWPPDGSGNPISEPPLGIRRHYCRLAVVQFDGKVWTVVAPCLPIFPPLTSITQRKGIHVTDVKFGSQSVELANDSSITLAPLIEQGLSFRVLCDAAVDPVSAQPTTCYVTVDLPYPFDVLTQTSAAQAGSATILGFQPLVLPALVSAQSVSGVNEIDLKVSPGVVRPLIDMLSGGLTSRFLTHLTLKGKFIWAKADPTLYLDGAAFGVARTDPDGVHIGLRLPQSGDGTPGSDFEMWFWLTRPVKPATVTFSPASVAAGQQSTGFVALDGFAPPGGSAIKLTPGSTVATLSTTSLNILAGGIGTSFTVTVPATAGAGSFVVTAANASGSARNFDHNRARAPTSAAAQRSTPAQARWLADPETPEWRRKS